MDSLLYNTTVTLADTNYLFNEQFTDHHWQTSCAINVISIEIITIYTWYGITPSTAAVPNCCCSKGSTPYSSNLHHFRPRRSRSAAAYSDQPFPWTICRSVRASVCPVHCEKTADRIRVPFGIIGRTGPGMKQVVGFGNRSTGRSILGATLGRAIVTNGDFTVLSARAERQNLNKRLCYCRGTARRAASVEILWPFFDWAIDKKLC